MRVLFVTWDGPETNYLESLFLPIFARLLAHGISFDVLQFRWGAPALAADIERVCAVHGIRYRARFIQRWPAAIGPFATAVGGGRDVRAAVKDFASDIIMPRSLMPALATMVAGGIQLRPILFDADGLEADERTEFRGLSKSSLVYRTLRAVESRMVQQSDAVLVRTRTAAAELGARAKVHVDKFHVVANGRDPQIFKPAALRERRSVRAELGIAATDPVVAYVGSVGGKYRTRAAAGFARALRRIRSDTKLLVLTGTPDLARSLIAVEDAELAETAVIRRIPPEQVSSYLSVADAGTSYIEPSFSMRAAAPVKLGEYLLCGVPVVGTAAVGETAAAVAAGVFLDEAAGPDAAARWIQDKVLPCREKISSTARAVGIAHFSLDRSVADYLRAFDSMLQKPRGLNGGAKHLN